MTDYKVIASDWFSPINPFVYHEEYCIGVVAIDSGQGRWKAYIGYGRGKDKQADEQAIAMHGAKLTKTAACGHFLQLDPDRFTL